MTGSKVVMAVSAVGATGGGIVETLLAEGNDLGQMGALGIMGVCIIALVSALVYRERVLSKVFKAHTDMLQSHSDKFSDLVMTVTTQVTKNNDKLDSTQKIESDLERAIRHCNAKNGVQ